MLSRQESLEIIGRWGKPDKQQQGEVVNAEDKGTPEIIKTLNQVQIKKLAEEICHLLRRLWSSEKGCAAWP